MQKNYFIAQESSRYSVRKQDLFFAFCVYKSVSQKIGFCMDENDDDCHHQKTTRTFIYTKSKKIAKRFYIQKARHFSKSKTISVTFLYTKSDTLDVTGFS